MKFIFLTLFSSLIIFGLDAQRWQVLEDNTSVICDTSLTGGASADTIYSCLAPSNGILTFTGLCASYTPNANYFGYDVICLTTCIGGVCTDSTLQITINPVGESIFQSTLEDANYFVCENVISGGSNVVISGCSLPLYGTANYNPSCVIYAPLPNYVGLDSFCIVSCIDTLCDTSTLVMNMTPVTDNIAVSVPGNGSIIVCTPQIPTIVDSVTSFTLSCGPTMSNGTVVVNSTTQCIQYTPNATFSGTGLAGADMICVSICNSEGVCDVTNINITITDFTVTTNSNATQLAQSLTGPGVSVTNAVLNCSGNATGRFTNANNALGIGDGVVLGTGLVSQIDNLPGFQPSTNMGTPGDADLNVILASQGLLYTTNDACALEFDVQVLGDSLKFNYVFSSEEYPEGGFGNVDDYVCDINDIFAFFVTGNNPAGGMYTNQNIATIPGTSPPLAVSINTINDGSEVNNPPQCYNTFTAFYNGSVPNIAFDGNTAVLQAKMLTIPCDVYHFKLVVGDGSDEVWDSGVFLEAGSFTSLPVTIASSTILGNGFVNAVEDCVDGLFTFELDEPLALDYGIKFQIAGSALNGVDYTLIQDSITFFAGDTFIQVAIQPITDGLIEGTETVKLYLMNNCTGLPFDSAELNIIDLIPFNINVSQDTVCAGDTIVLHATIAGDDNNLAVYNWTPNNGTILDVDSGYTLVIPTITQDYYVEYTLGACTKIDTTPILVSTFSLAYDTNYISCPGANDGGFTALPSNSLGNVTYQWLPSLNTDSFVANLGQDTVMVTTTDQSGLACGSITDTLFLVEPIGLNFNSNITNVTCYGLDNGAINITSLAPNTTYTVDMVYMGNPLPQQSFITNASGNFSVPNLPPGLYDSILITNPTSGCFNAIGFSITEPDTLLADLFTPGVVLCSGGAVDSLSVTVSGGITPYSYLWNTSDTSQTITGVGVGIYWVLITDFRGCLASDTFIVGQPNSLVFTLLADSVSCFNVNNGMAYIDSISGGTSPYAYLWDASAGSQANDTAVNLLVGTYILTVTDFNGCQEQQSITIDQSAPILLSLTNSDVSCFEDNNGSINVTVAGGNPSFSYAWTGPNGFTAITEDVAALFAGSYALSVTDSLSCISDTTVVITSPPALSTIMNSTNVTCNGLNNGTAAATVSGGTIPYTYLWDDALAQISNPATGLAAGIYQVFVSDGNSCMDTAQVLITEPDSLLMTIDNVTNAICNGAATIAIAVSTTGGTTPYTYLWTNGGGTNEDLANATVGTYTLTVTDSNACTYQITQAVTEPAAIVLGLVPTHVLCFGGNTGAIDATISGGIGPYTYGWTGPNGFTATTQDISNLFVGSYTLVVTDANNCTRTQSLSINEPAAVAMSFFGTSVNCLGGNDGTLTVSVQSGGVTPFSFQWDAAANNQVGATATGLTAGIYSVTVTDGNVCTYVDSAIVFQPLAPLTVFVIGTGISCAGYNDGIATASAQGGTPGYTYLWNDPLAQTTAQAIDLSSNTYQVTVTDINGCTATYTTFIDEPAPIIVVATPDSANCWGEASGAISLLATGGTGIGFAYSLDGGATFQNSPNFLNLPAGVYTEIIVKDIGATALCYSQLYTTTVFEQAYFSFEVLPADTTLQLEESVVLSLVVTSPNYTASSIVLVSWNPTIGLNCSDCIDPTVLTYEHYTEYVVSVSYEGGDGMLCTASSNSIIIVENNLDLFIPNAFTPGSFDDMNNVFEVFGEGIEYVTMQVFNRWGEKVFESSNQKVAWDGTFKGELQNPGVFSYYVKVEYLDGKIIDRKGSVSLIR